MKRDSPSFYFKMTRYIFKLHLIVRINKLCWIQLQKKKEKWLEANFEKITNNDLVSLFS